MKILFVCYANACRSQMAEAYARFRAPDGVEIQSAGMIAAGVWPQAREAMAGWEIHLDGQTSKRLDDLADRDFDLVISLSEKARKACDARFPEAERLHWPILDPAGVRGSADEVREVFALTRQDLAEEIDALFEERFGAARLGPRPARSDPQS